MKKYLKVFMTMIVCFLCIQAEAQESVHFACPAESGPVAGGPFVPFVLDGESFMVSVGAAVAVKKDSSVIKKLVKVRTSDGKEIYVLPAEKDTYLNDSYEPFLKKTQNRKGPLTWRVSGYVSEDHFYRYVAAAVRDPLPEQLKDFDYANRLFVQNLVSWVSYLEDCGYIERFSHPWEELQAEEEDWMDRFALEMNPFVSKFLVRRVEQSEKNLSDRSHKYRTGTPLDIIRENAPSLTDGNSLLDLNQKEYLETAATVRKALYVWSSLEKINIYKKSHADEPLKLDEEAKEFMHTRHVLNRELVNLKTTMAGL